MTISDTKRPSNCHLPTWNLIKKISCVFCGTLIVWQFVWVLHISHCKYMEYLMQYLKLGNCHHPGSSCPFKSKIWRSLLSGMVCLTSASVSGERGQKSRQKCPQNKRTAVTANEAVHLFKGSTKINPKLENWLYKLNFANFWCCVLYLIRSMSQPIVQHWFPKSSNKLCRQVQTEKKCFATSWTRTLWTNETSMVVSQECKLLVGISDCQTRCLIPMCRVNRDSFKDEW